MSRHHSGATAETGPVSAVISDLGPDSQLEKLSYYRKESDLRDIHLHNIRQNRNV